VNNGGTLFLYGTNLDFGLKPMTLSGAGWGGDGALITEGSSSWEGDVTLTNYGNSLIYNYTNSSLTLAGMITGPGGFIKDGPGTNTLAGGAANPYSGATYVNRGILNLMKASGQFGIGDGALTIGTGLGSPGSAVVRSFGNNEIFFVPLTVNSDGLLDLNGNNDLLVSYVTLNDANIQNTSAGTLSLYTGTIITVNPGVSFIAGNLNVETNSYWTNSGTLNLPASVAGNANIYKSGPGGVYLEASNSFTGLMVVQQGWLYAENNYALGATSAGTIVSNGASLVLQGNVAITNEPLTLNGLGESTVWGALDVESGTNIWAGPITVNSNCTLDAWNAGSTLHINGQISGAGGLELFGYSGEGGTHYFEGASTNSYAGTTTVDLGSTLQLSDSTSYGAVPTNVVISGTLRLAGPEQINSGADVLVNAGGLFDFGSFSQNVNTLRGTGNITFGLSGYLEVGGLGGTSEFDGLMSGTGYVGGFTVGKTGTGTFTMTGNNTYLNRSDVYGGTLVINGLQPQSPVYVSPGSTLRGSGSVGPITAQGIVYPGDGPGILNSGNVTFSSSGVYRVDIDGPNPGTGYDQLNVVGTVTLASATLQLHMTVVGTTNSQSTIINNDGTDAVTNTFFGLPEGATVVADNGVQFKISYHGGTGNDVVLTQTSLPAQPVFTGISNLGGGGMLLNGTGFTNLAYTVQGNTNLATPNWISVGTATANGGGQLQFTDPTAANYPIRFYRFTWP
jgi:autotransporter-associated beta strand protein